MNGPESGKVFVMDLQNENDQGSADSQPPSKNGGPAACILNFNGIT
jgi:hypothetical protein